MPENSKPRIRVEVRAQSDSPFESDGALLATLRRATRHDMANFESWIDSDSENEVSARLAAALDELEAVVAELIADGQFP